MIAVTDEIAIDEREIRLDFVRAPGPGGQNVNKVSSAVQLRFDVLNSLSLPMEVRARLARLAGSRMTSEGFLIIQSRSHRTQELNRQAAIARLVALVRQAATRPKARRQTKTPEASRRRRLEAKRRRSQLKQLRSQGPDYE